MTSCFRESWVWGLWVSDSEGDSLRLGWDISRIRKLTPHTHLAASKSHKFTPFNCIDVVCLCGRLYAGGHIAISCTSLSTCHLYAGGVHIAFSITSLSTCHCSVADIMQFSAASNVLALYLPISSDQILPGMRRPAMGSSISTYSPISTDHVLPCGGRCSLIASVYPSCVCCYRVSTAMSCRMPTCRAPDNLTSIPHQAPLGTP